MCLLHDPMVNPHSVIVPCPFRQTSRAVDKSLSAWALSVKSKCMGKQRVTQASRGKFHDQKWLAVISRVVFLNPDGWLKRLESPIRLTVLQQRLLKPHHRNNEDVSVQRQMFWQRQRITGNQFRGRVWRWTSGVFLQEDVGRVWQARANRVLSDSKLLRVSYKCTEMNSYVR
jgi:hypothetical protein